MSTLHHRTNADKRAAVQALLDDPEWSDRSARQLARAAGVSVDFAARMKCGRERKPSSDDAPARHRKRGASSDDARPRPSSGDTSAPVIGTPTGRNAERDAAILALYAQGTISPTHIAKEVGWSPSLVSSVLRKYGATRKWHPIDDLQKNAMQWREYFAGRHPIYRDGAPPERVTETLVKLECLVREVNATIRWLRGEEHEAGPDDEDEDEDEDDDRIERERRAS